MYFLITFGASSPVVSPISSRRAAELLALGSDGPRTIPSRAAREHVAKGGSVYVWKDPYVAEVEGREVYLWSPSEDAARAARDRRSDDI